MKHLIAGLFLLCLGELSALSISQPTTLFESQDADGYQPHVVLNEKGDGAVIWQVDADNDESILCATVSPEGNWSPIETILESQGTEVSDVITNIDSQGDLSVGWKLDRSDNSDFYQISRLKLAGGWATPIDVMINGDEVRNPYVIFNPTHDITLIGKVASFKETSWGKTRVDSISLIENIISNKNAVDFMVEAYPGNWKIQFNREGRGFACGLVGVWENSKMSYTLQAAFSKKEGGWTLPIKVCDVPVDYSYDVAGEMNSREDVVILLKGKLGSNYVVYGVTRENNTWSSLEILAQAEDNGNDSVVSIDDQGNIVAAWILDQNNRNVVFAAHKLPGGNWSGPVVISSLLSNAEDLTISNDNQGHFVIVWADLLKKQGVIRGATFDVASEAWSCSQLSPKGDYCGQPSFQLKGDGKGLIAWSQLKNNSSTIQVAELSLK